MVLLQSLMPDNTPLLARSSSTGAFVDYRTQLLEASIWYEHTHIHTHIFKRSQWPKKLRRYDNHTYTHNTSHTPHTHILKCTHALTCNLFTHAHMHILTQLTHLTHSLTPHFSAAPKHHVLFAQPRAVLPVHWQLCGC